jgi:short subunit dehydrogenase-like uncharacterized protein
VLPKLLIYGATGYSGRLIVQQALVRGLRPVIAGRDRDTVTEMATACSLQSKICRVDESKRLRSMVAAATVVLNAAGPFATTSAPLMDACLVTGTHYLDITGEAEVNEATQRRHDAALRRNVMLMPAVGFEVVASDCLAAHVSRRLPSATTLKLGYDGTLPTSRGSLRTTLGLTSQGILVRRKGKLVSVAPGSLTHEFDFGSGPQDSLAIGLGDVSSAFFSTGIPNIETYMRATLPVWSAITVNQYWGWLLSTPPWQSILRAQTDWLAPGPSPQARREGWATLVADAKSPRGRRARSRLRTGDVYSFTALSAIGVAERVLADDWKPGFQTPSQAYGADFVLSFDGVSREDL